MHGHEMSSTITFIASSHTDTANQTHAFVINIDEKILYLLSSFSLKLHSVFSVYS
jgi:hypothetical protein